MKTIRRLYFYAVALVSLEVVLWGLISLLRSMVSSNFVGGTEPLAQALALIVVGVPIFGFHWRWAQRASTSDEEEQTAMLRALFLYFVLLITLIPVIQNILAVINRAFISGAGFDAYRSAFGGSQTLADNIIAVVLNSIIAAYFFSVEKADWRTITDKDNHADARRLYRYVWVLYSLIMIVFGTQQILRFILYIPTDVIGEINRAVFINRMVFFRGVDRLRAGILINAVYYHALV